VYSGDFKNHFERETAQVLFASHVASYVSLGNGSWAELAESLIYGWIASFSRVSLQLWKLAGMLPKEMRDLWVN
jgi:hypothetical protein